MNRIQRPPSYKPAQLLEELGMALYGDRWQGPLSVAISVSDRSMRRWVAETEEIPDGVWRDIYNHAEERWLTIKYLDEQIEALVKRQAMKLHPIKNPIDPANILLLASPFCHFNMSTPKGQVVRCHIAREVFDDRVKKGVPSKFVHDYFNKHSDVFFRTAQRKFADGDLAEDGSITIANVDLDEPLPPDTRYSL